MRNWSIKSTALLLGLSILSGLSLATETRAEALPLQGQLALGAEVDNNGVPVSGDSRFHFTITGLAAKSMYESLPGRGRADDCSGFIMKTAGNVICYAKTIEQAYSCHFAINIEHSSLESSASSCR